MARGKEIIGGGPIYRERRQGEISVSTYVRWLRQVLEANKGWLFIGDLERLTYDHFKSEFSKDDLRIVNGRPKWINSLAWAKVNLKAEDGQKMTAQRLDKGFREYKGVIAYFRRFGPDAAMPSQYRIAILDGGHTWCVQLGNVNGVLATYRISPKKNGGFRLTFVSWDYE